jgi:hypothetical protein
VAVSQTQEENLTDLPRLSSITQERLEAVLAGNAQQNQAGGERRGWMKMLCLFAAAAAWNTSPKN